MPNPADRLQSIAAHLEKIESLGDEKIRAHAKALLHELMEFHAAALEKLLDHVAGSALSGVPLIDCLAADPAITPLLLLHGLHPLDLETRVLQALEKARPYLRSHGGNVELLGITDGVVRVRLVGSCHGCPSSAVTLRQTIEEAVMEKAPDVAGIEVEEEKAEPAEPAAAAENGRVALPILS